MALHDAHQDQEGNCVHHGPGGDTINEPLGQGVPEAELWLPDRLARNRRWRCFPGLHRLQLGIFFAAVALNGRVRRECSLEELLPVVVWRCRCECEEDEAKQLGEVKGQRSLEQSVSQSLCYSEEQRT